MSFRINAEAGSLGSSFPDLFLFGHYVYLCDHLWVTLNFPGVTDCYELPGMDPRDQTCTCSYEPFLQPHILFSLNEMQ